MHHVNRRQFLSLAAFVAAAALFLGNTLAPVRAVAATAQGEPLLGSPDFYPSPERPIGWRADGTGRFPAANPPTQWGRTIKGFYAELQCQAGKPQGPAKAGELLNMGFLRDWVIIGPFDTKDFKTGVDEDILQDETRLQPQRWRQGRRQGLDPLAHLRGEPEQERRQTVPGFRPGLRQDRASRSGRTTPAPWNPGRPTPRPACGRPWPPSVRLRIEGQQRPQGLVQRPAGQDARPV